MKRRLTERLVRKIRNTRVFPLVWRMTLYYTLQRRLGFPEVKRRFRDKVGYDLNLENPLSLNEKLTHRKLFCRDPVWIEVTDKVAVRDWLVRKGLVGEDLKLIPLLGVFRTAGELRRATLPQRYIAKAAWASGRNFIVRDHATDLPRLTAAINRWLIESPTYRLPHLIWASWHIPRRIIVEEFLVDDQGTPLADYKFFVFHGRVRFFYAFLGRFGKHGATNAYDGDKKALNLKLGRETDDDYTLPDNIDNMIKMAERIGAHFDFVRVDFYSHAGTIYFGELTMTPDNGSVPFHPQEFDQTAGAYWNYPAIKDVTHRDLPDVLPPRLRRGV